MTAPEVELSAIVIAYDGMKFLPDCLRTLSADLQEIDHEIIIVDNGSTDGTLEYLSEHYPSATLIANETNLGFAAAVNQGLKRARGRYFYVLNQDLRFRPGTTRTLLARLKEDTGIGLIGPKYIGFDGHLQRSARALPAYRHIFYRALFLDRLFPRHRELAGWRMGDFDHLSERFVPQPMGAVMMIPREVIERVGYFDESFPILFNDVDFCRRLRDAGYKALYYPQATVEHFVGGSTRRTPVRLHLISHHSLYRYLKKYARPSEYPLLWLCGLILLLGLVPVTIAELFRRHR
jgi:GT2 family glycosyltransferase